MHNITGIPSKIPRTLINYSAKNELINNNDNQGQVEMIDNSTWLRILF